MLRRCAIALASLTAIYAAASVSIKTGAPAPRGPYVDSSSSVFRIHSAPARYLIQFAYQVRSVQIIGGPAWADADCYDVTLPSSPHVSTELRAVLTERFQLKLHHATKELPVYALTVSKRGLRMEPSSVRTCAKFQWTRDRLPNPTSNEYCGAVESGPNPQLNHTLDAIGISTQDLLTTFLGFHLDRIVIDKTGLTGRYNFHLEWNVNGDEGLSLRNALEDQLGLKLDAATGPVDALIIDHIEKPRID